MDQAKRCITCREEKSLDDFYGRRGAPDGHRNSCKACDHAANRNRRWRAVEKARAANRATRARGVAAEPDRIRQREAESARKSYWRHVEVNRAKARGRARRRRQESGDALRAADRAYWATPANRERKRERQRKISANLTPEQRAQRRANWERWKDRNLERERARIRETQAVRLAQKLNQFVERVDPEVVVERDRGYCGICGLLVEGPYHIDHVVPISRGGLHCYANVQLAHPFCNISKGTKLMEDLVVA